MKLRAALCCFLLPLAAGARDAPLPRIMTTVEMIEVSSAEAQRLLVRERLGPDGPKLREALQRLLDAGQAEVVESMVVAGRSGESAENLFGQEYRYPKWEHEASDGLTIQPPWKPNPLRLPVGFQSRNVGTELEVEPRLSPDYRTINLRVRSELVFHVGTITHLKERAENGTVAVTDHPLMYSLRIATRLHLGDGQDFMLAVISPRKGSAGTDPSRKCFVMIRCDVVAPTAKPSIPPP